MALRGGPELRARLKAIKVAFKPVGKQWADETARLARAAAPVRTGTLRNSIHRKNASQKKATVSAVFYGRILDVGAKEHDIKARRASTLAFPVGGQTIFAKKTHHPRQAPLGFATNAAHKALRDNPMAETLVKEWNAAA